ncbi:DNA cytosine methyltransferase [Thalassospira lucentensis]|uniref:DNA cytosine methyltransferase n=1 Tax=Thalassospira lucentensis TaxID=168935 RepID=UPI00142E8B0A|nr:DNA cytosine methyltransferase [Thalassospira lucentensis]NIZ03909.1 DNA cytosine methyltransferase [Thalassospira lucentensis]
MYELSSGSSHGPYFIDLFAGAGGMSEGFVRAGFLPIAHVEMDVAACYTLRTREAFHRLSQKGDLRIYSRYAEGQETRTKLYEAAFGKNAPNVVNAVICRENLQKIFDHVDFLSHGRKPDVLIGGPPCQAYSLVGRARSELGMIGDYRNYLFVYYVEFLKRYRPKYFVFENVVGLLSAREKDGSRYLDMMMALFEEVGYSVEWQVLSSDDFGVPQKRKRIILVGREGRKASFFPEISKRDEGFCVNDVIGDLPSLSAGDGTPFSVHLSLEPSDWLKQSGILSDDRSVTWHDARPHNDRDLQIFKEVVHRWESQRERLNYNDLPEKLKTHKNRKSFLDRFKVVASNLRASHTIVAHIAKDGNYYIHPDSNQNRSLTPREAARIQTFPDNYYFEGASEKPSRTSAFKQIGNAVPVLLAQQVAESLLENWS